MSAGEDIKYNFWDPSKVESPRSTLLRYGLPYKPYDFTKDQEHQVADHIGND